MTMAAVGFGCLNAACAAHTQERMEMVLPWIVLGLVVYTVAMIYICWKIGRNDDRG